MGIEMEMAKQTEEMKKMNRLMEMEMNKLTPEQIKERNKKFKQEENLRSWDRFVNQYTMK